MRSSKARSPLSQPRTLKKALRRDWPISKAIEVLPSALLTTVVTSVMVCATPLMVTVMVGVPLRAWPSLSWSRTISWPSLKKSLPKAK
ncbi:hypothetical protein D3C76_880970 [compost metagenome]